MLKGKSGPALTSKTWSRDSFFKPRKYKLSRWTGGLLDEEHRECQGNIGRSHVALIGALLGWKAVETH